MDEADLEGLMARYQAGEAQAFDALYRAISPRIYAFLVQSTRDRVTADDLLQEVFVNIHRARATYRTGAPVLPWVYAIARHAAVNRARSATRRARHEEVREDVAELAGPAPVEDPAAEDPRIDAIRAALDGLPASQREVVLMLKVSGLSLAEVARATGSTVGAVKLRAHRAYQSIRKKLNVRKAPAGARANDDDEDAA